MESASKFIEKSDFNLKFRPIKVLYFSDEAKPEKEKQ
jgi:hypothetical protein